MIQQFITRIHNTIIRGIVLLILYPLSLLTIGQLAFIEPMNNSVIPSPSLSVENAVAFEQTLTSEHYFPSRITRFKNIRRLRRHQTQKHKLFNLA
ncbi:hypothetical protein [Lyngbya sp. PCC 8106]|uniref:hypothetical protein n=1 Tax=Lyngbya sp. (strain PCC 8106) TaxID=313612 RepID=UPI0000EAA009|nr:hypothetical protein [Lyngbya sp. PCC 8106]EAW38089.1 hypothetical protein L8106_24680 [Lyngbya sp. PCC 8106]